MSVWDDPDLQAGGEYYEFTNPGDFASGTVKVVRTHTWDDGKKVPQLILVDDTSGEDRTLTASTYRLKATLVEQRPNPGDHLRVTYKGEIPLNQGKKAKDWDVVVTRGGAPVSAPIADPIAAASVAPPAPAAPAAVDPAAAAAALAALSPEQRAALGL